MHCARRSSRGSASRRASRSARSARPCPARASRRRSSSRWRSSARPPPWAACSRCATRSEGARVEAGAWSLHGIRLRTADLDLRVMTEADLPTLWSLLPDDLEMNPHATTYAGLDDRANRRAVLAQGYWRALGMWSPDDWALPFVVRSGGHLETVLGVQWLEGPDWRSDRTVDSSSWLVSRARGKGLGKQM